MSNLFQELKRRNIFRVGLAYLIVAWLILQVGSIVAPALSLPDWTLAFIIFIISVGFPLVLLFAWAFELTPEGLKRSDEVDVNRSVTADTGKRLNYVIIGVLALAVIALLADRFITLGPSEVPDERLATGEAGEHPGQSQSQTSAQDSTYESIAVLPFVNMSDDVQQEYFSDGISEELLNLLAKIRGLRVAARTSSFAFKGQNQDIKGIGEQLDVDTILEGSVRKSGTKLRITAQLIETDTGYHLWSDTYDRELTDVFAIQDEISAAIVAALKIHLSGEDLMAPKVQVTNVEAYNAYLKGRHGVDSRIKSRLYAALTSFDQATQLDPNYAPAHAAKAEAYLLLSEKNYGDLPEEQSLSLAEAAVARALELDPNLADAYAAKGLLLDIRNDHQAALATLTRAIEISPNLARAYLWRANSHMELGQRQARLEDLEVAFKLDPLFMPVVNNLYREYIFDYRLDEAQSMLERLRTMRPDEDDREISMIIDISEMHWAESMGEMASAYQQAVKVKERYEFDVMLMETFMALRLKNLEAANASTDLVIPLFWANYIAGNLEGMDQVLARLETIPNLAESDFAKKAKGLRLSMEGDEASCSQAIEHLSGLDLGFDGRVFGPSPRNADAPQVILGFQACGDEERANNLLELTRSYVTQKEQAGFGGELEELRLELALFDGNWEKAFSHLKRMHQHHNTNWGLYRRVMETPMADMPQVQALNKEHNDHINAERAKLGWPPVE